MTPFRPDSDLDESGLRELVARVEDRGVDFDSVVGSSRVFAQALDDAGKERLRGVVPDV